MTDKELKILDVLRGSMDSLSADEIAKKIYGPNSPSELVKSKLEKLECQGFVERFYMKDSYKFIISDNYGEIKYEKPNEQLIFDFVEDINSSSNSANGEVALKDKSKSKVVASSVGTIEKILNKDNISDINKGNIDEIGFDDSDVYDDESIVKKGFKGIFVKNKKASGVKQKKEKDSTKKDSTDSVKQKRKNNLDFINEIKADMAMEEKVELEGIFNKEIQLKEQFNKAWSEILKEEKDYYSLMDDRSFSLLKSALNNINCISTFRTTIAFIKRLENIFDISDEELLAIEQDSRALKVNDSSFDVEHLGKINIIAEIKCNVSTNGSNRFGAGLTASLKKDIDSLISGKPRSRIKDVNDCYKFMVIYKNDEIIDDAIKQLIDGLPNDLSKYLLVYRDGMIMSKDYVYIYVM